MAVSIDKKKIDRLLTRRVVEVIVEESLRRKLASGKRLRVKLGFDPTAPDLHLGHAVLLKKLGEFQELGHRVVFIVGDYTAMVGDPTGKSKTRPMLSEAEVKTNAETYLEQAGLLLDLDEIEVRRNSEWFSKMDFGGILKLCSQFTVARMLERDDFSRRLKDGVDVHAHELLYPMMQAYDSIMVEADVEIGGSDQRFNMLAGRDLQRKMGKPEQDVLIAGPILVGTDGVCKMSKSLGNYVGLAEPADEMFGKLMSIPDSVLWDYFSLATELPEEEIAAMRAACGKGEMNPRDAKMKLAGLVVAAYHSEAEAMAAEARFRAVFQKKEAPEDVAEFLTAAGERPLVELLVETKLAPSKGEARRVISQGGVKVDGIVVSDPQAKARVTRKGLLIQKGKRWFVRVRSGK